GVAANPDDTRPRVGADDGAERLDHQCVGYRFRLPSHPLGIALSASVADDETDPLAMVDLTRQVDHAIERAVERAHALERGYEPVANAKHGLYLQHRAKQCARAPDAASAPQEFQRCD